MHNSKKCSYIKIHIESEQEEEEVKWRADMP